MKRFFLLFTFPPQIEKFLPISIASFLGLLVKLTWNFKNRINFLLDNTTGICTNSTWQFTLCNSFLMQLKILKQGAM